MWKLLWVLWICEIRKPNYFQASVVWSQTINISFLLQPNWMDNDIFTNTFWMWWICSPTCQSWKQKDQQISEFLHVCQFLHCASLSTPKSEDLRTHLLQPLCFFVVYPQKMQRFQFDILGYSQRRLPASRVYMSLCRYDGILAYYLPICCLLTGCFGGFDNTVQFIFNAFYLPSLFFSPLTKSYWSFTAVLIW